MDERAEVAAIGPRRIARKDLTWVRGVSICLRRSLSESSNRVAVWLDVDVIHVRRQSVIDQQ